MKIKNIFELVLLCFCLSCGNGWANLYRVTGVPVVAERSSALAAKEAALTEGQVVAFKRLLQKLSPENALLLPDVSEETILSYVQGVSIENEKTTATKYMGNIAVEFDPAAVKALLNTEKVTYLKAQPPSLLVIPVYEEGEQTWILDEQNPLYMALKEKGSFAPFYQAIVPEGNGEERQLVQQNIMNANALLPKYKKEKVMLLRLVREDESIWQINSEFYPSSNMDNQVVRKKFRLSGGNLNQAAGQMAMAVFRDMEGRWRNERTSNFDEEKILYLRVPVDTLSEWQVLEKEIKNWAFFEDVRLKGLYLPQVLLEVVYKGSEDVLSEKLRDKGWEFDKDETGNGATLRRVDRYE